MTHLLRLSPRRYQDDADYWRVREFLRQVFVLNGRRELSWHVNRWDYWRWHGVENIEHFRLEDVVSIWETADGRIAAVLNPEGAGEAFMHLHPGLAAPALVEEMLDVAEAHLAAPGRDGQRRLRVWAGEHDASRQAILAGRGYAPQQDGLEYQRRLSLEAPIPEAPAPVDYSLRALGEADELPRRSWVSWQAFHPDEPDERYGGYDWYHNIQRAPLYRRDLDLVAVAANGDFAAFCTVWFDDVTRTGVFEPVGAAPAHHRRGLGRALMCMGLRRLKWLGATQAHVGSYSPAAHGLYEAVGFTEYDLSRPWVKAL